MFQNYFEPIY